MSGAHTDPARPDSGGLRAFTLDWLRRDLHPLTGTHEAATEAAETALRVIDAYWLRVPMVGVQLVEGTEVSEAGGHSRSVLTVTLPDGSEVRVSRPWRPVA